MFIKKDLRKIPKIIDDAALPPSANTMEDDNETTTTLEHRQKRLKETSYLKDLRLGRRQQEFQGSIHILCQPKHLPKLSQLETLNLYDCGISDLTDIGLLQSSNKLQVLNLGRNPISTIPDELSQLSQSLKELWLDDCQLSGVLADSIMELSQLQLLHASNNRIEQIPSTIEKLSNLQVLCIDRNQVQELPEQMTFLPKLQSLLVRHNRLSSFPSGAFSSLKLLHVSSNQLKALPDSLVHCKSLTHLYANSNQITSLPVGLEQLKQLQRLVLSHNQIECIDTKFWNNFTGLFTIATEGLEDSYTNTLGCTLLIHHNPIQRLVSDTSETDDDNDLEMESAMETQPPGLAIAT